MTAQMFADQGQEQKAQRLFTYAAYLYKKARAKLPKNYGRPLQ